jgi:DNA-directed RNA polymerase alpha subunit
MASNHCGVLRKGTPIEKLELDPDIAFSLRRFKVQIIGDLTNMCACQVLDIPGVGWKALGDIIDTLHDAELRLHHKCRVQRED